MWSFGEKYKLEEKKRTLKESKTQSISVEKQMDLVFITSLHMWCRSDRFKISSILWNDWQQSLNRKFFFNQFSSIFNENITKKIVKKTKNVDSEALKK